MAESFYRWFSERRVTRLGASRRERIERWRLALLNQAAGTPGRLLEVGPGQGAIAAGATGCGWQYRAIEASPVLADELRGRGFDVVQGFVPPIPLPDGSSEAVYADQVLEHMTGLETARAFVAEAHRVLCDGGVLFVVVPDFLSERGFFYDIDYTHNFPTTERRVRQLLFDAGFVTERVVRSIGLATGLTRDLLAALSLAARVPGLDAVARHLGADDLLFRVRKNLFETLTFIARKPAA